MQPLSCYSIKSVHYQPLPEPQITAPVGPALKARLRNSTGQGLSFCLGIFFVGLFVCFGFLQRWFWRYFPFTLCSLYPNDSLHETRQRSHCLKYAKKWHSLYLVLLDQAQLALKQCSDRCPIFCIFNFYRLHLYSVLKPIFIFTRAALFFLAWAFYRINSSHFYFRNFVPAFYTYLFYIKHLNPLHFKTSLWLSLPSSFLIINIFS